MFIIVKIPSLKDVSKSIFEIVNKIVIEHIEIKDKVFVILCVFELCANSAG